VRSIALQLALAAVFAAGWWSSARAEFDIYGMAHISVDQSGNGDHDPATRKTATSISSNQSNIGLRGREGLRDQLFLIFQAEGTVHLDDGRGGKERDSFVGLESGYGTVLAGRYGTPYRRLTDRLDIFSTTHADYSAVIGSVNGESIFGRRANNILFYTTPESYRLRFAAAYIANQERDELPLTDAQAALHGFSMALTFDSGPLYAGAAYQRLGQAPGPDQTAAKATKAAIGWDFREGTKVALIWEKASSGARLSGLEESRTAWYANASHVSGNTTYKIAYGMTDSLRAVPGSGAQMFALGFSYALSRRTEMYLLGTGIRNHSGAAYALQTDPDDPDSAIAPAAAGDDVYVFSAGLIHRFDIGF